MDGGQGIAQIVQDRVRNAADAGGSIRADQLFTSLSYSDVMALNVDASAVNAVDLLCTLCASTSRIVFAKSYIP
jgi:hypothetical protein